MKSSNGITRSTRPLHVVRRIAKPRRAYLTRLVAASAPHTWRESPNKDQATFEADRPRWGFRPRSEGGVVPGNRLMVDCMQRRGAHSSLVSCSRSQVATESVLARSNKRLITGP